MLQIEIALVAGRNDHVVISRLQLQPIASRLTAVIAFAGPHGRRFHPGLEPVLNLPKPVKIITRWREVVLTKKFARRVNLGVVNRRSEMYPRLEPFNQSPGM